MFKIWDRCGWYFFFINLFLNKMYWFISHKILFAYLSRIVQAKSLKFNYSTILRFKYPIICGVSSQNHSSELSILFLIKRIKNQPRSLGELLICASSLLPCRIQFSDCQSHSRFQKEFTAAVLSPEQENHKIKNLLPLQEKISWGKII